MCTRRLVRLTLLALALELGIARESASADEPTLFPPEARQRYQQGKDLQKKGNLNEALAAYDEAIKLGMDTFPRVHLDRARANLDLKKYDDAIALYTKFIVDFGLEESCRA
jgi:tetratricopeptide (TPR) repeat protein